MVTQAMVVTVAAEVRADGGNSGFDWLGENHETGGNGGTGGSANGGTGGSARRRHWRLQLTGGTGGQSGHAGAKRRLWG